MTQHHDECVDSAIEQRKHVTGDIELNSQDDQLDDQNPGLRAETLYHRCTPCECISAGFCQRHNIRKPEHWVKLCATKKAYFDAWENGRGPGRDKNRSSECPHLQGKTCEIASEIAGLPVEPNIVTCKLCSRCKGREQRLNVYTLSLAAQANPQVDAQKAHEIMDGTLSGFGTKLASVFAWAVKARSGCGCKGHQDVLDMWTKEYIQENLDKVIDWLETEAKARHIPFARSIARVMLLGILATEK